MLRDGLPHFENLGDLLETATRARRNKLTDIRARLLEACNGYALGKFTCAQARAKIESLKRELGDFQSEQDRFFADISLFLKRIDAYMTDAEWPHGVSHKTGRQEGKP